MFRVGDRVCVVNLPMQDTKIQRVVGMTGTVTEPEALIWVEVKMDEDISDIDSGARDNTLLFMPDEIAKEN